MANMRQVRPTSIETIKEYRTDNLVAFSCRCDTLSVNARRERDRARPEQRWPTRAGNCTGKREPEKPVRVAQGAELVSPQLPESLCRLGEQSLK